MAHSSRGWTGARTPSAIKRVRQAERKRAVNQPRRTAAKTLAGKAMLVAADVAGGNGSAEDVQRAVERAVSALDRAAKIGAIHRNAADRRKSRLMLKVNAALGGEGVAAPAKTARQVSKQQATKLAKARIAASRASKAKGAQTAAGKARAALAKTSRAEGTESAAKTTATAAEEAPAKPATRRASSSAKATTSKTTTKASASKASASKANTSKTSAKKS